MYDPDLLLDRLYTLLEALERIPRRFAAIATPADFTADDAGIGDLQGRIFLYRTGYLRLPGTRGSGRSNLRRLENRLYENGRVLVI